MNGGEKKARVHMNVGRVTVDLIRRSWVRFPPRSKDFFFASCGSLFPFTRANAQWVIDGFRWHLNLHFRVNSLFHYLFFTVAFGSIMVLHLLTASSKLLVKFVKL